MLKVNFLPKIVFEILRFKKLSNPIDLDDFQLQLKNYIFHNPFVFIDPERWCII